MNAPAGLSSIAEIDNRIQHSSKPDHRRALRTQRNMLIPVSTLPPELLLEIFRLCIAVDPKPDLAFFQTCTLWRILAQADCQLWRIPDFSHPALATMMLVHARAVPLVVKAALNSSENHYADQVALIRDTVTNKLVETLELVGTLDVLEEFIRLLATEKLQAVIKQVSLENTTDSLSSFDENGLDLKYLSFPHLHSLYLRKCLLPSCIAATVCSLRSLEINLISLTRLCSDPAENVTKLLYVLWRNPNLERVTLIAASTTHPHIDLEINQSAPKIHLRHLKHLHIGDGNLRFLILILGLLELPALTKLRIQHGSVFPSMTAPVASSLIDALARLVSSVATKAINVQDFTFRYHGCLHFDAVCFAAPGDVEESFTLKIALSTSMEPEAIPVVLGLPLCFPLKDTKSCEIEVVEMDNIANDAFVGLWSYLATVPALTSVKALDHSISHLLGSFERAPPRRNHSWFHSLKRLDIVGANLDHIEDSKSTNVQKPADLLRLASLLRSLQYERRPLPNIVLSDCLSTAHISTALAGIDTFVVCMSTRAGVTCAEWLPPTSG
jgi:hypothetical protein